MRVAVVQPDTHWEDPAANCASLRPIVAEAAAGGAELVVLTEMYATGFSMRTEVVAETDDGPSTAFLREMAAEHDVWICGSVALAERVGQKPGNTLVLAGPGGAEERYTKIHPFTYSGEHQHYRAGDERVVAVVGGVRLGLFVCYDLRFADEFWALAADVDAYVVVANWPAKRREHWKALLRARAIENQAYVIAANRVGRDGNDLDYAGDSCVIDPLGETIVAAAANETVLMADVDAAVVAQVRERFPFLVDRR